MSTPVVEATDLSFRYPASPNLVLQGVTFRIEPSETLGLVGQSGSGKSTIARLLLGLEEPTAGSIRIEGQELTGCSQRRLRKMRPRFQMVFQDTLESLHPRHSVRAILREPLIVHGRSNQDNDRSINLWLERVGLHEAHADRYPHQLSGGERQRIALARALILEPRLLVADEPVSSLDPSVRAQILNLLSELQADLGLAMLLISHEVAIVARMSDSIAVLHDGRLVEWGSTEEMLGAPTHPETRRLLGLGPSTSDGTYSRRAP